MFHLFIDGFPFFLQLIVLLIGLIALSLIVVIDRLGTIFELTLSLGSVTGGAIFGLFTSGMLCRYMNTKVVHILHI